MVKLTVVLPAATVTGVFTVANVESLETVTPIPPVGALPVRVTVPSAAIPAETLVGEIVSVFTAGVFTVSVVVAETLFAVPFRTADVFVATGVEVTVTFAAIFPAATVTDEPMDAAFTEELRVTFAPPVAAALERVTTAVALAPPTRLLGDTATDLTVGALTAKTAVFEVPLNVAFIVAFKFEVTATVLVVNVADLAPAAIFSVAGGVAEVVVEASVTLTPPAAATPESVTVPVLEAPPATLVGETVNALTTGAVTAKIAVFFVAPWLAVIVTDLFAATATELILKVTVVLPEGTVAVAGTVTEASDLANVTTNPALGAAAEIVIVPVAEAPPRSEVGETVTDERLWASEQAGSNPKPQKAIKVRRSDAREENGKGIALIFLSAK